MKRLFLVLTLGLILSGCSSDGITHKEITQEEAYEMMTDEVIILDVREPYEFEAGHIEGAINLPLDSVEDVAANILEDKDATILVYCTGGVRSKKAAKKLASLGYTDVNDFGGISTWEYGIVK